MRVGVIFRMLYIWMINWQRSLPSQRNPCVRRSRSTGRNWRICRENAGNSGFPCSLWLKVWARRVRGRSSTRWSSPWTHGVSKSVALHPRTGTNNFDLFSGGFGAGPRPLTGWRYSTAVGTGTWWSSWASSCSFFQTRKSSGSCRKCAYEWHFKGSLRL
mgnify:CR=1 FL=1